MKKTSQLLVTAVIALTLAGCTSAAPKPETVKDYNFGSPTLKSAPVWDVDSVFNTGQTTPTAAPENNPAPTASTPPKENKTSPSPSATPAPSTSGEQFSEQDTFSPTYIKITDKETSCTVTAQISYLESYRATRGDEFNSKDFLYQMVPPSQSPVQDENNSVINKVEYVVGSYSLPSDFSEYANHRTAVRVFSTPLTMENSTGFSENELGNYNSDLTKGLPVATIDLGCASEKDLTNEKWDSSVQRFTLLFK